MKKRGSISILQWVAVAIAVLVAGFLVFVFRQTAERAPPACPNRQPAAIGDAVPASPLVPAPQSPSAEKTGIALPADFDGQLPARIRGVTILAECATPEVVRRAADYGVNFIGLSIHVNMGQRGNNPEYFPTEEDPFIPYTRSIEALDEVLPVCRENNIKLRIGIVPWGRNQDYALQGETGNIDFSHHLYQFWDAFARRYKDEPAIAMYSPMLEPNEKMAGIWQNEMLPECIRIIRDINPDIWIAAMPVPWGQPKGFESFGKIDDPHVVYCFHPYAPHCYLHQGIFPETASSKVRTAKARGQEYPGMLQMFPGSERVMWNRERLKAFIQPAVDFSQKYGVRMFADEFAVVRWAPGADAWTEDMLSLLEEAGFDWCTFNLAGWNGWNPTFEPDDEPSFEPYGGRDDTPILDVWKKYWNLNKNGNAGK